MKLLKFATSLLVISAGAVNAGIVINIYESGSDVVVDLSGAVDLTGRGAPGFGFGNAGLDPSTITIGVGADFATADQYLGITGEDFGDGNSGVVPVSSAETEIVSLTINSMSLPTGYTSNTALSLQNTYTGTSFASIGLTPGTYYWTWDFDSEIAATVTVVPEPSSTVAILSGICLIGILSGRIYRRRRV